MNDHILFVPNGTLPFGQKKSVLTGYSNPIRTLLLVRMTGFEPALFRTGF